MADTNPWVRYALALAGVFALVKVIAYARASEPALAPERNDRPAEVPCAVIESAQGDVVVMDRERVQVLPSASGSAVPCGGWVSTGREGFARVRHRDGYKARFARGTLAQIETSADGAAAVGGGDQIRLFRGRGLFTAGNGAGELRILTPNARARVRRGDAIVTFPPEQNSTQLVVLEEQATLENRFEIARRVVARAGEGTELSLALARSVPDTPRAVALGSLRGRLRELQADGGLTERALALAHERRARKFAAELGSGGGGRSPASSGAAPAAGIDRYARHDRDPQLDAHLRGRLERRLAGADSDAEATPLVHPRVPGRSLASAPAGKGWARLGGLVRSRAPASQFEAAGRGLDPEQALQRKQAEQTERERKRLLEELSKIHPEE